LHITQRFSTTFFNKTADLVEKPAWVDFEMLGLYLGFAAALAGLGAPRLLHMLVGRKTCCPTVTASVRLSALLCPTWLL